MSVFISYSRRDRQAVEALRSDIARAHLSVWIDDELTGGQAWWDTILGQIRACELFVVALSPDSLHSKACAAELEYALALGRPLLAVKVAEVAVQLAPPVIANSQIVDYTHRSADSAIGLMSALNMRPRPPALPDPLPVAPPIPISYMNGYLAQVEAESLPYLEQTQLLTQLRGHLRDEYSHDVALQLITRLRARPDITEAVGREIDGLLATERPNGDGATLSGVSGFATPTAAGAGATAGNQAAGWYPDPTRRAEMRYWSGSAWTDHVSRDGRQFTDPVAGPTQPRTPAPQAQPPQQPPVFASQPPQRPAPGLPQPAPGFPQAPGWGQPSAGPAAFSSGAFTAMILASLLCSGWVGLIVGGINLKHPARKAQAKTLLICGAVGMVLGVLVYAAMNSAGTTSDF